MYEHPKQIKLKLISSFRNFIKKSINVSDNNIALFFPPTFFSNYYYLAFPYFFESCFERTSVIKLNKISCSLFLFFKYLMCVDALADKDLSKEHENYVSEEILFLRLHIYHEESMKILGNLFPKNSPFWKSWNDFNAEYIQSALINGIYMEELNLETYKVISLGKCAHLKATVSAVFFISKSQNDILLNKICRSLDFLAIAKCLLDDFSDFSKDLYNKKNNYGHSVLKKWIFENGIGDRYMNNNDLSKLFYLSKSAESIISLSISNLENAYDIIKKELSQLKMYSNYLKELKQSASFQLNQVRTYRIECGIQ